MDPVFPVGGLLVVWLIVLAAGCGSRFWSSRKGRSPSPQPVPSRASKSIEQALGQRTSERLTTEFYASEGVEQQSHRLGQ